MRTDPSGKIRRFYKEVGVVEGEGGFSVALDGRPVRTPAKAPQTVPTRALAEALAAEWAAQVDHVDPSTMPLTKLVNTVLDRVSKDRAKTLAELARFAEHDLVCYRVEEPEELAQRQVAAWQPLVDWAARHLDAPFIVTTGILPIIQPEAAIKALIKAADDLDDWRLLVAHDVAAACRSVVIGMAAVHGVLDARAAFLASEVDEAYQRQEWGEDAEAMAARELLRAEIHAAMSLAALVAGR